MRSGQGAPERGPIILKLDSYLRHVEDPQVIRHCNRANCNTFLFLFSVHVLLMMPAFTESSDVNLDIYSLYVASRVKLSKVFVTGTMEALKRVSDNP